MISTLLQVIVLYDDLLPANSTFKSQISSLHKIPSVETLGTILDTLSLTFDLLSDVRWQYYTK